VDSAELGNPPIQFAGVIAHIPGGFSIGILFIIVITT